MRRIVLLDTETTGLDPAQDRVIEVGAILYSVEHASSVVSFASLIRGDANPAAAVNRIPEGVLADADDAVDVWPRVARLVDRAEAVVAYHAEFDRAFVPAAIREARPWICAQDDLSWPRQSRAGQSLVALALEHDLGIAVAHRALADCELMARLFTRARELGADLEEMLARGLRPKATFVALVPYAERERARAAGFRWDAERRQWRRRMAVEDAGGLPFRAERTSD